MTRAHQVLVSASPGDATTSAALGLQEELRRCGPSEIFAAYIDPAMAGRAQPLGEFPSKAGGADVLVVHVTIGNDQVSAFLAGRREPIAVIYHNISPPSHFLPWHEPFARLLAQGRAELAALAGRARVAIGVSGFNAAELEELGFANVQAIPLPVDLGRLQEIEPDEDLKEELEALDGPVVLHVGQLLPHKRVEWLIWAYHALVTHIRPQVHLLLVGPHRLPPYRAGLAELAEGLGLARLRFTGSVSEQRLVACYRAAGVVITASEHEGVCVPVLEAMAFGVPVVARDFAALSETLDGAGILLGPGDGPLVAAEALAALLDDEPLRSTLAERAAARLGRLDPAGSRRAMVELILAAAVPT